MVRFMQHSILPIRRAGVGVRQDIPKSKYAWRRAARRATECMAKTGWSTQQTRAYAHQSSQIGLESAA